MTTELIDCRNLESGSIIDVETRSRHYLIECLGGNSVRVSGHPEYCPTPVPAKLEGSLDQDGVFDYGHVERGRSLIFKLDDGASITTSKVVRMRIN